MKKTRAVTGRREEKKRTVAWAGWLNLFLPKRPQPAPRGTRHESRARVYTGRQPAVLGNLENRNRHPGKSAVRIYFRLHLLVSVKS